LVPAGLDQSQAEFAGIGQTGGEKAHTLLTAEMPAHTHTVNLGGVSGGQCAQIVANGPSTTMASGSAGSDTAHNNLQPYITLQFIIRAL
jgi:microcystin-dependent protein